MRHHDSPRARCTLAEVERLRAWKREAIAVLTEWEEVWVAAGCPGVLGQSKPRAVRSLFEQQLASAPHSPETDGTAP